jgi:YD repeat-containing protein
VTYLDGTTETVSYACCGMDSQTDREGVTTSYTYDAAKRQVATTRLSITTTNVLDAAGRVLQTVRIGSDTSRITNSQSAYNLSGEIRSETNAMNGVTIYSRGTNASGQTVLTNTYPDGGVRIETLYHDGSLLSVSGTAAHPELYLYGVDADGEYKTEIKVTETGGTNEWVKTSTDLLGRAYKTTYAAASAPYPSSLATFNSKGQLTNQVDPDGVITLLAYNPKGEQVYSVLYSNRNYTMDGSGSDQITFTTNDVVSAYGTTVRRSRTYVWKTFNSNVSNLVSLAESSVDGLRSWQTVYRDASTPVTSSNRTVYSGSNRYVTNTAPDGSYTVSVSRNGRPISITHKDSGGNQIAKTIFGYDSHGRQNTTTDARNGTTTFSFNNADWVTSVTTPNPGAVGGSPQTTLTYYNQSLQATSVVQPDGAHVFTEYSLTGELKKTWGGRTYPVAYSYDYAGRLKTMTNWTSFPSTGARVTTWNYDAYRGWLTNKTYDGGAAGPIYSNKPAGRLASRKWARNITTTYGYNNAGALARIVYSDGTTPNVTNTFDRLGRAATTICNGMTTTHAYNDASELLSETFSGGTLNGLTVTNAYDAYLRRTAVGLNTQLSTLLQFGYDTASRLSGVTNGFYNASYGYLANSPLVTTVTFRTNSVTRMTTTKTYDYVNRLTSISSVPSGTGVPPVSFAYNYNSANQRTRVTLGDGSYWLYEYDSLGQVRSGKKYWYDGTPVAGQQFDTYGNDGSLLTETNALEGVTTYSRGTNASGQTVLTNTYPDGGVRIETYCQDGSLLSVTGSAVHPVQYLYGVDGDGAFTTEIKVTETGGTNEWVKTSTDLLGRAYKTTYAAASAPYPFSLSTFHHKGQLTNQVASVGVVTLTGHNPKSATITACPLTRPENSKEKAVFASPNLANQPGHAGQPIGEPVFPFPRPAVRAQTT